MPLRGDLIVNCHGIPLKKIALNINNFISSQHLRKQSQKLSTISQFLKKWFIYILVWRFQLQLWIEFASQTTLANFDLASWDKTDRFKEYQKSVWTRERPNLIEEMNPTNLEENTLILFNMLNSLAKA